MRDALIYLNREEIAHEVVVNGVAPAIEVREEGERIIDLSISARSVSRARGTIDRELADGLLKGAAVLHVLEEPRNVAVNIGTNNRSRLRLIKLDLDEARKEGKIFIPWE